MFYVSVVDCVLLLVYVVSSRLLASSDRRVAHVHPHGVGAVRVAHELRVLHDINA